MKKKIINGIMMVALVAATSTLTTLENQYGDLDGRVSAMKNRLDDVQALAEQNRDDIDVLQLNVDAIEEEIGQLELWLIETFAKLVTSVEISGTYNNMLGSINIPGFEPKMLIFNYGVASKKGSFPESLDDDDRIKWGANEEIGAGEYNPGNAGFIYANVNRYLDLPLLTKAQDEDSFFDFKLVNTRGDEADGVIIENADEDGAATDDVLQWGWTRADNNIYKFAVKYTGDEAKNFTPAKIDLSLLKNDLKAIWADRNRQTGTSKESLGHLVADLYYNYATKDTNMKKYALKIAWMDNTTWKYEKDAEDAEDDYADIEPSTEGLKHMVTSEAELVFASIKPLAFTSGDALAEAVNSKVQSTNNLIEKMEPYINKILNKIKNKINIDNLYLDPAIFNNITTNAAGDYVMKIAAGTYLGQVYYAPTYYPGGGAAPADLVYADQDLEININDLVRPMETAFNKVDDMIDTIKELLGKINGENIGNWMMKFTNKFNTLFANNADQLLQPVLLAAGEDGTIYRVSGIESNPSIVAGEVTLKPTTYTAELFAPAYAKYVGCKDIQEDNFNQIIFSGDQELKFTPEAGKVYEIVYEAVDYFGNTVKNNYYILGGVK